MADTVPASVDVRQHPHPDSTISMPTSTPSDSYDASAHPTPFLMAGFNPQARLRKTQQSAPSTTSIINNTGEQLTVTVTKQPPNKLAAAQLAPVSVMFVPPSIEPTSANAPEPVQTRPRARSSHEAHSPRAAVVAQQIRSPRKAKAKPAVRIVAPLPPRHEPSPAHVDDATFDFFTGAAAKAAVSPQPIQVSSTASTATSTPVQSQRRVDAETSSEEEEEEEEEAAEEDERERKQRKKERKAARKAKKEAKKAAKKTAKKKEVVKKDLTALPPVHREKIKQTAKWLAQVDYYWHNDEVDMVTSTGMGIKKRHITWRFVLDSRLHELELFHSRFSGKRRIRLDSVELVNEKVLFDGGSSHEIFIGERMLEVVIFIETVKNHIQNTAHMHRTPRPRPATRTTRLSAALRLWPARLPAHSRLSVPA